MPQQKKDRYEEFSKTYFYPEIKKENFFDNFDKKSPELETQIKKAREKAADVRIPSLLLSDKDIAILVSCTFRKPEYMKKAHEVAKKDGGNGSTIPDTDPELGGSTLFEQNCCGGDERANTHSCMLSLESARNDAAKILKDYRQERYESMAAALKEGLRGYLADNKTYAERTGVHVRFSSKAILEISDFIKRHPEMQSAIELSDDEKKWMRYIENEDKLFRTNDELRTEITEKLEARDKAGKTTFPPEDDPELMYQINKLNATNEIISQITAHGRVVDTATGLLYEAKDKDKKRSERGMFAIEALLAEDPDTLIREVGKYVREHNETYRTAGTNKNYLSYYTNPSSEPCMKGTGALSYHRDCFMGEMKTLIKNAELIKQKAGNIKPYKDRYDEWVKQTNSQLAALRETKAYNLKFSDPPTVQEINDGLAAFREMREDYDPYRGNYPFYVWTGSGQGNDIDKANKDIARHIDNMIEDLENSKTYMSFLDTARQAKEEYDKIELPEFMEKSSTLSSFSVDYSQPPTAAVKKEDTVTITRDKLLLLEALRALLDPQKTSGTGYIGQVKGAVSAQFPGGIKFSDRNEEEEYYAQKTKFSDAMGKLISDNDGRALKDVFDSAESFLDTVLNGKSSAKLSDQQAHGLRRFRERLNLAHSVFDHSRDFLGVPTAAEVAAQKTAPENVGDMLAGIYDEHTAYNYGDQLYESFASQLSRMSGELNKISTKRYGNNTDDFSRMTRQFERLLNGDIHSADRTMEINLLKQSADLYLKAKRTQHGIPENSKEKPSFHTTQGRLRYEMAQRISETAGFMQKALKAIETEKAKLQKTPEAYGKKPLPEKEKPTENVEVKPEKKPEVKPEKKPEVKPEVVKQPPKGERKEEKPAQEVKAGISKDDVDTLNGRMRTAQYVAKIADRQQQGRLATIANMGYTAFKEVLNGINSNQMSGDKIAPDYMAALCVYQMFFDEGGTLSRDFGTFQNLNNRKCTVKSLYDFIKVKAENKDNQVLNKSVYNMTYSGFLKSMKDHTLIFSKDATDKILQEYFAFVQKKTAQTDGAQKKAPDSQSLDNSVNKAAGGKKSKMS